MLGRKICALVLFSGGLDSMLAAKLLLEQGVSVTGLCFESNFFNATRAAVAAKNLGIELKTVDVSAAELDLVKNPPHGYGKNLNPCLDCHALMIKEAGRIARAEQYDFIATGEVLGQRPFSQTRVALDKITRLSGEEILRPLSAKCLPETVAEKNGLIDRHRLLDIKGRSRQRQMALAKRYGLTGYSTPAGGCLLTDAAFSQRLIKLLDHWPDCDQSDAEPLKYGRVFWLNANRDGQEVKIMMVIGRNQEECEKLKVMKKKQDLILEIKNGIGPTTLLRAQQPLTDVTKDFVVKTPVKLAASVIDLTRTFSEEDLFRAAGMITAYYSPKLRGKDTELVIVV
jgi:tRNA-uridine 2-sulfurtransferase